MNRGWLYALICFGLWGVSPLFWKQLQILPPMELICLRVIITSFTTGFFLYAFDKKNFSLGPILKNKSYIFSASLMIAINWYVYVYAVNSSQVLQGSLGYFMGPTISFVIGVVYLSEKLSKEQILSFVLFIVAVLILGSQSEAFPWISITLALTFALYGLIKKKVQLRPRESLFFETLLIIPLCLIYLFINPSSLEALSVRDWLFLSLSGLFTYLPLYYFGKASQLLPLSAMGTLQYLAPIGQFMIGLFWYKEPFNQTQLISYSIVWVGIMLFIYGNRRKS